MEGEYKMKTKMKIKILIDFLMTISLLFLMAYQITGQNLHEWLGAGMLVLFIIHNILNLKWYGNLFRGGYRPARIFKTVVNFAVLICILSLGYSGIVMSRHLFSFLSISRGMALARVMHLAASYWGFVLMSLHFGIHWGTIIGAFKKFSGIQKNSRRNFVIIWILRVVALFVAVCGGFLFLEADIFSYMFLRVEFVFFDFEKSSFLVLAEYAAMMELWVLLGYYISKGLAKLSIFLLKKKEKVC